MWHTRGSGVLVGVGLAFLLAVSLGLQLDLPRPTGPYPVGRTSMRWAHTSRQEPITASPDDVREVVAIIWYPAKPGTGSKAPYFPDLDYVASGLKASGEVHALEVAGLPFIRSNSYLDAELSDGAAAYPVVLFSPGNGTNVEFYAGLADELASHGYIVAGLNHPYDVAAVELRDGSIAQFASAQWPMEMRARIAMTQERIDVRTEDVLFVLDQLEALNTSLDSPFAGRLDLSHIGVMGHSLGGITAAQACQQDQRFQACLNLDGLQEGGAFSARRNPELPIQPFMLITKEEQLPQSFVEQFERLPAQSYRVTVHGASHDHFTDGPLLMPSVLPLANRADRIHASIRAYTLAFFDQVLKGQPSRLLAEPREDAAAFSHINPIEAFGDLRRRSEKRCWFTICAGV